MSDTHIGFLMMLCTVVITGGNLGFLVFCRMRNRWEPILPPHFSWGWMGLMVLWYLGTLAVYPSFMGTHRSSYMLFAALMIVLSFVVMLITAGAVTGTCLLIGNAIDKRDARRAVY